MCSDECDFEIRNGKKNLKMRICDAINVVVEVIFYLPH